ncbi:MAG: GNAT family N-acetyltransferase [Anaerolineae bacterium]|nr:GNAT family N-acetyltransferase [Anaerolineae bacterium]
MPYKIPSSTQSTPITKIDTNFAARIAYFGRSPYVDILREKEIMRLRTNISFPHYIFNVVPTANFSSPESAHAHICSVVKDIRARNTTLFWSVGPSTAPIDLGYYLEAHGFEQAITCSGMTIDMGLLNEEAYVPSGFTVERVMSKARLEQFVDVLAENSHMPRSAAADLYKIEASLGYHHYLPRQRYIGIWHGQPVATTTLFFGGDVVGIYHVATVPQARGYGIASAMSLAALQDARRWGHRQATLIATPQGQPVYRRLGFQPRFEYKVYAWSTWPKGH